MNEIIINDELKNLLPPLSAEEYAGLEADILERGCLSALVVWDNVLVDGFNRYKICKKHNLSFEFKRIEFESIDDAKLWILKHQANRRNLTPYRRAEIALKLKPIIAEKARKNCSLGGGNQINKESKAGLEILPNPVDTRKKLAQLAGISDRTLAKVEYIAEHADEAVKEKLRCGEKGTSIDKEYKRLKPKQEKNKTKTTIPPAQAAVDESGKTETANNIAVSNTEPEEVVDTKQFLQKHYSPYKIKKLVEDVACVFPDQLRELPFIFFGEVSERLRAQDKYEGLEEFLVYYFRISATETRNCILKALVDYANKTSYENQDKHVLKKPRRTKSVKR